MILDIFLFVEADSRFFTTTLVLKNNLFVRTSLFVEKDLTNISIYSLNFTLNCRP